MSGFRGVENIRPSFAFVLQRAGSWQMTENRRPRLNSLKSKFFVKEVEPISKIVVFVQGQGVDFVLKRSVHEVREHLKQNRNAAIGRKMHF